MSSTAYQYQAAKLKEIKNTLQSVLDNFQEHPEQIAEMLAFKSQFYNYSMNNTSLIYRQNPGATYVASFQDWKKKGFHVLKGQHGMKVLFPIRTEVIEVGEKDGKKQYRRVSDATLEEKRLIALGELKPISFTRFGIGNVFDISQTNCPPEKYPEIYHMGYSSEQHAALYQSVKQYAERIGLPVKESDLNSISIRGSFNLETREIQINDKLNDTERLSTLTHELGHAITLTFDNYDNFPVTVQELEADCISIMLQSYVGIELTDSRKGHFVGCYNACTKRNDFKLEDILKNVNLAYYNLHQELEPLFDQVITNKEPPQSKKEVRVEDLAVGQRYYDKELDKSWNDSEIKLANEMINEPDGPRMSASEIEEMFDKINNHREIVEISRIYQENGKTMIDTSAGGEISAEEFLARIHDRKTILEPENSEIPFSSEHQSEHKPPVSEPQENPPQKEESVPPVSKTLEPKRTDYKEQDAAVLDKIKYGISIVRLASDLGFTPKQLGAYYTLKEHDSVRIYPETNSFTQFSSGVGGSTIDFAMHFCGYNKQEAIQMLKERYAGHMIDPFPSSTPPKQAPKPKQKDFVLPDKIDGKYSRVFAYLSKTRCIEPQIIQKCIKDGLLYEDVKHNAVFVGIDVQGTPAYATRRSTLTKSHFKRDVAGGRQDIGFFVDNHAEKLYVCEAPIDALSIMSLMRQQGKPIEHASYLATCGTGKDKALYTRLRDNPQIREVVLANDRDTAGWKASKKMLEKISKEFPHIQVSKLAPKQGKDINEYLCAVNFPKQKSRRMEVER